MARIADLGAALARADAHRMAAERTAALFSQYWYFANGIRSAYVEAGLRSLGPLCPNRWGGLDDIAEQLVPLAALSTPFPRTSIRR